MVFSPLRTALRVAVAAQTLALLTGCSAALSAPVTLGHDRTTVGGEPVSYVTAGERSPTIVLEAGLGDGMASWRGVIDDLATISGVFAYDRPGYGASRATSRARDAGQVVEDLRTALTNTGHNPPYVLVGHSLGGDYMLHFAATYPNEVVGLVLVDARHPEFTRLCIEQAVGSCEAPRLVYTLWPPHVRREYDAAQRLKQVTTLGNLPLAVISSASERGAGSKEWRALWSETQKDLASLSTQSTHVVAKRAGHYVHRDEPGLVLDGVRWVMSRGQTMSQ